MKKAVKIIKKIFDVLCWITVIILALTILLSVISRFNGSIPSVFGYSVCRVSSGSMEPELSVGDVILGKDIDNPKDIKVGDVVTFKGSGELAGEFITHKVIVAPEEENGVLMLQTQGIANPVPDSPIAADRVVSVMIRELPFMNVFYDFFFSPWGLLTIVGLIIIVFIDELILMIKTIMGVSENKKPKDINEIINKIQSEDTDTGSESNDEQVNPDVSSDN